jgi:hypothetical protein
LTTIIPDPWHIPPAIDAAAVHARGADADRQARIDSLDDERMRESLHFLAGYAPGVLDAILTATEPCLDDERPDGDDALEPYCTACGAPAGIFIALGSEWSHYAGNPETADVIPYPADHPPLIGWRPATGPVAVVAL